MKSEVGTFLFHNHSYLLKILKDGTAERSSHQLISESYWKHLDHYMPLVSFYEKTCFLFFKWVQKEVNYLIRK